MRLTRPRNHVLAKRSLGWVPLLPVIVQTSVEDVWPLRHRETRAEDERVAGPRDRRSDRLKQSSAGLEL